MDSKAEYSALPSTCSRKKYQYKKKETQKRYKSVWTLDIIRYNYGKQEMERIQYQYCNFHFSHLSVITNNSGKIDELAKIAGINVNTSPPNKRTPDHTFTVGSNILSRLKSSTHNLHRNIHIPFFTNSALNFNENRK